LGKEKKPIRSRTKVNARPLFSKMREDSGYLCPSRKEKDEEFLSVRAGERKKLFQTFYVEEILAYFAKQGSKKTPSNHQAKGQEFSGAGEREKQPLSSKSKRKGKAILNNHPNGQKMERLNRTNEMQGKRGAGG